MNPQRLPFGSQAGRNYGHSRGHARQPGPSRYGAPAWQSSQHVHTSNRQRVAPQGHPQSRFRAPRPEQQSRAPTRLVTNAFSIGFNQPSKLYHEYSLSVIPSLKREIDNLTIAKSFVSSQIRHALMKLIVDHVDINDIHAIVISQSLDKIFTTKPLKEITASSRTKRQKSDRMLLFEKVNVEHPLMLRPLLVDVTIKFNRTFTLNSVFDILILQSSLLHHHLLLNYNKFGNTYFSGQNEPLQRERNSGIMSSNYRGISIAGIRHSPSVGTFVVLNSSFSHLTDDLSLIDILARYISGKSFERVKLDHTKHGSSKLKKNNRISSIQGNEEWFQQFKKVITGYKCRTEGLKQVIGVRLELTDEPTSKVSIVDPVLGQINVVQFYQKHGYYLNYPNLPCLIAKSDEHSLYPFELCALVPGQKVPIFRLDTVAKDQLNTLNKQRPRTYHQNVEYALRDLTQTSAKIFAEFDFKLSLEMLSTDSSQLGKPLLKFADCVIRPINDYWESGRFFKAMNLIDRWCVIDTVELDTSAEANFFADFVHRCKQFGILINDPRFIYASKEDILRAGNLESVISQAMEVTGSELRLLVFVIDANSTPLNRLVHLSLDNHSQIAATCIRTDSIMNTHRHRSIFRSLAHKLNARLGFVNVEFTADELVSIGLDTSSVLIIGLDVTHPDNELTGVSIVGCSYTFSKHIFLHRSLVFSQTARQEIVDNMDELIKKITDEYMEANQRSLPEHIIIYRDGVSNEEFVNVEKHEVSKIQTTLSSLASRTKRPTPKLSFIIAQKRHTMRFFDKKPNDFITNPAGGTLICKDVVVHPSREFYLFANSNNQATSRPGHYHVLIEGLPFGSLQRLTYFLCFNFGRCSTALSMPSCLKYAHNAAYDARNRIITSKGMTEGVFYRSKFFC